MPPKWRQFTQEQLAKMVKDSTSFRDFTIKLGYVGDSGNGLAAARAVIKEYQFDISLTLLGKDGKRITLIILVFGKATTLKVSRQLKPQPINAAGNVRIVAIPSGQDKKFLYKLTTLMEIAKSMNQRISNYCVQIATL